MIGGGSLLLNIGSNIISGKSECGSTYYLKKEDVEYRTINVPAKSSAHNIERTATTAYSYTECKANGFWQDLAGL